MQGIILSQGVFCGDHRNHLVLEQNRVPQPRQLFAGNAQNQIQLSLQQGAAQGDASILHNLKFDFRPDSAELRHNVHHEQRGNHGSHPHPQLARGRGLELLHKIGQRVKLCNQRQCPPVKLLAVVRQIDPRWAHVKEGHPQLRLQLLDHLAQGGLGDIQLLRRPGKVPALRHLDKVL